MCNWALRVECKTTVFLPAALVETEIATASCQTAGCNSTLTVDGIEEGLLRFSRELAFSHELLRQWEHRTSQGVKFWTFWRDTLLQYEGVPQERKAKLFEANRKNFQAACLAWIHLQRVDYNQGACGCGAKHLISE